ncbi:MAG: DUF4175 family protein [Bacteroidota bacterium]
MNQQQILDQRLQEFRKKYYLDKILRGSLILALLFSSILFVALLSEGLFGFSSTTRTVIVFGLGTIFLGVLGFMVVWPGIQLIQLVHGISDFHIASLVKDHFPDINDKLINFLQLRNDGWGESALAQAAINQKASEIAPVQLSSAINLNLNKKYLWYLGIPILLYLGTYFASPGFLGASSHRLFNYDQSFLPPPPFEIAISDIPKEIVAGESFDLDVTVNGDELPADLYVFIRSSVEEDAEYIDYNLTKSSNTEFSYTLSDLKEDFTFFVGNPEVRTDAYDVKVMKRPFIKNFQVKVNYPNYTGLASETLENNVGDFKVLKGSVVSWELQPQGDVESAYFVSNLKDKLAFKVLSEDGTYGISKRLMTDMEYFISLQSPQQISNIDTVKYRVNVQQDRFPSIYIFSPNNDFLVDLDPNMPLDLEVSDDFGFTNMTLFYRFVKSGGTSETSTEYRQYPLALDKKTLLQPLNFDIDLTQLGLKEGDELEYYIKVWDNDGVSGPKAATSATFKVVYPTLDAKYDEVGADQDEVKDELEELKKNTKDLKEAYKKMREKLLDQKKLSFDDKKEIQRMVEEHKNMLDQLNETQEKFEETKDKLQENQMISEETLEKYDELNEFLENLDNPEIEEMLKELEERMENLNPEDIMEKLEKLQMNDEDLKKSLERTLELFKQLEVQQKVDELRNKLDKLESKQRTLNDKLEQAETPDEMENAGDRQEDLNEQMQDIEKDLDELKELKEDTQTPNSEEMESLEEDAEETEEEMENASQEMKEASEQMQEGGRKNKKGAKQSQQKASESQKKAADKMQEMSESLSSMQMDMQMQQDQQNLEDTRELLENLLKLSFDQEDLRDEVKALKYRDPSLKEKSQTQKKLQDDMGLVSDSLESLANRVFQIQKMVLDESQNITDNMKKSQTFFRNKQVPMITYHQQESMTSVNNLANMLTDLMKQMQEAMMNAQAGQGMCQKPGGKKPQMQGMGEKQRQLNEQMRQMMQNGQMDGDKLAEMAARQEAIRKQLQEAKEKMEKEGGKALGNMDKIMQDMKESENDMINKQLSHETFKRQQQILSRLLQAEQSVRERELDDKRESKTARVLDKKSPEELSLEEYKNKIRQEMLKSNKLEYSSDFIILIEQYYKKLEGANE